MLEGGRRVVVARSLEMSDKTLSNWVRRVRKGKSLSSRKPPRVVTDLEAELSRLRTENAQWKIGQGDLNKCGGEACESQTDYALMRQAGIRAQGRCRRRYATQSQLAYPITSNRLAQQFAVTTPNRVLVPDITYVATDEGWVDMALVMDLFSRKLGAGRSRPLWTGG